MFGLFPQSAVKQSAYLMDTAREFRLKLKSASSFGAKKGQPAQAAPKPTHATVYVAKTYPPWQCTVLSVLKQFYESGNGNDNKAISQVNRFFPGILQMLQVPKLTRNVIKFASKEVFFKEFNLLQTIVGF